MSNLNYLAFPFYEPGGTAGSVSKGFSKHELATILIAAQISGDPNFTVHDADHIADISYTIAKAVLSKFDHH